MHQLKFDMSNEDEKSTSGKEKLHQNQRYLRFIAEDHINLKVE